MGKNLSMIKLSYFFKQLVIRRCTSCRSSKSSIAPKYPIRLSVNRGLAINFKHSSWPKCAGYPSICIYNNFAIFRHLKLNRTISTNIITMLRRRLSRFYS